MKYTSIFAAITLSISCTKVQSEINAQHGYIRADTLIEMIHVEDVLESYIQQEYIRITRTEPIKCMKSLAEKDNTQEKREACFANAKQKGINMLRMHNIVIEETQTHYDIPGTWEAMPDSAASLFYVKGAK